MTEAMPVLAIVHAASTWFMVGLIWFVQVVHYPLMAQVGEQRWSFHQAQHMRLTTFIVAPMMLIEVATAMLLLFDADIHLLAAIGAALLLVVWVSTFAIQVPAHARLRSSFDPRSHRRLVATNWIRTVAWSLRGIVAALMVLRA